jgi:predicted RND superfamily exporter protein
VSEHHPQPRLLREPWQKEPIMIKNESNLDRGIRVVLAVLAIAAAFALGLPSVPGVLLLVVAAVLGVTAAVGFCPLYRVFGLSTCPVPQRR